MKDGVKNRGERIEQEPGAGRAESVFSQANCSRKRRRKLVARGNRQPRRVWLAAPSNGARQHDELAAASMERYGNHGTGDTPPEWPTLCGAAAPWRNLLLPGNGEQESDASPPRNAHPRLLAGCVTPLWGPRGVERAIEGHDPLGQHRETIRQFPRARRNQLPRSLPVALGLEDLGGNAGRERRDLGVVRRYLSPAGERIFARRGALPHRGSCTRMPGNADGPGAALRVIAPCRQDVTAWR